MDKKILLVQEDFENERLDSCIAEQLGDLSRTLVKKMIAEGRVLVNGAPCKPGYRVKEGDEIMVRVSKPVEVEIKPQDIPLEILYQDEDIVVVNKPIGMVVHPAHGNWDNTLVNALLYHVKDLSRINGELRPGIVHRLDKDTSGVMVVAKNDAAHRNLAAQLKDYTIDREYQALVQGAISENLGIIDAPIGRSKYDRKKMAVIAEGKPAVSHYQVLQRFDNYTLLKVKLVTGRTHQIRVHFSYIKHPIVGDPLYGTARKHLGLNSQVLHAYLLGFKHPRTAKYMEFQTELPPYFQELLSRLGKVQSPRNELI